MRCSLKNYVLRNTAVIIVYGEPMELPRCGAEKICVRVSAWYHSIIIIIIIRDHHCLVSPGLGLFITLSSSSLSFWVITAQSVRVSAWYHFIIIITIIQDHLYFVSPGLGLFITLIIIIIIQDHHCLVTPGLCLL